MKSQFFGKIQLDDGKDHNTVQILKAGKFDWWGEPLHITREFMEGMKKNFDDNVKQGELAVDFFHRSHEEAAGWIKDVILKDDDTLWINVDWTDEATDKIKSKKIKYMSIDFDQNYVDNETRKEYGPTINGAGLTNRPFIKGMSAVFSEEIQDFLKGIDISSEKRDAITRILDDNALKGKNIMPIEFTEIKKECAVLSDDQKTELRKIIGQSPEVITMAEENTSFKSDNVKLKAENKLLSDKIESSDKEAKEASHKADFDVMLSDGKAVESQREAWMENDLKKFSELSQEVNLKSKGSGATPKKKDDGAKEPENAAEASAQLSELTTKKMSENKDLSYQEAGRLVFNENPEIVELSTKL